VRSVSGPPQETLAGHLNHGQESGYLRVNVGDGDSAVVRSSPMTEKIGIGPAELRGIPLFRGFSDEEVQRLAELFEPVGANEGDLLFSQGEAAGDFYVLIAGEVSLRQDEREVYLLKPPCLIGELGATTGILRHCRAVVGPATVLRRIDSARLHDFCSRNPDIGLAFYRALLGSAADKIAHDQRRTAEMREHIIVTQKTMKGLRDFILESPDSPISRRVHDALEGLIQQNRRANYRVEPPPALASYLRLDDGRLLLVYNPVEGNWGPRSPLTLTCSSDNGKTWHPVANLETEAASEFSYPAIVRTAKGGAISYTWKRQRIRCWQIPLSALE